MTPETLAGMLTDSIEAITSALALLSHIDPEGELEVRLIAETADQLACRLRRFAHAHRLALFAEDGK